MRQRAVLLAGAVWFVLAGLLGMHVLAAVSAVPQPAASSPAGHGSAVHVAMPAVGVPPAPPGPDALPAAVAPSAPDLGAAGGGLMVHAGLACLVLLLVAVAARRHRPVAWLPARPPARAPAHDVARVLSRLSAALRWRTDPVRQAVLLT